MKFYTSIAPYYDYVFPLNTDQVRFILNSLDNAEEAHILDIGCGTGNLTVALSKVCNSIIGIDLDTEMLRIANEKIFSQNIEFKECNMLALSDKFSMKSFDSIVCFGNTLVHLNNKQEIESFLTQCHGLLKKGGKLLIQIINYDRILDEGIQNLPTIENDQVRFVRNYDYLPEHNEICFTTELLHKTTCTTIDSEQFLFPLRKLELEETLMDTGFHIKNKYGGFKYEKNVLSSIPFVIEVEKT